MSRAVQALTYLERSGGVVADRQLGINPLVTSALNEYMLSALRGETRFTRKAPQTPVAYMVAFVRLVVSSISPRFLRMLAWFRLVRVWACLRAPQQPLTPAPAYT